MNHSPILQFTNSPISSICHTPDHICGRRASQGRVLRELGRRNERLAPSPRIFELWEVAVLVFRVARLGLFLDDDLDGAPFVLVQHVVNDAGPGRADAKPSARTPRLADGDDEENDGDEPDGRAYHNLS